MYVSMVAHCIMLLLLVTLFCGLGCANVQDWFLTNEEIVHSRGGHVRQDLETYTLGNDVYYFVDTKSAFQDLYSKMKASGKGDQVELNFWGMDNIRFEPHNSHSTLLSNIRKMVWRGTSIYGLVWKNRAYMENMKQFKDFIQNKVVAAKRHDQPVDIRIMEAQFAGHFPTLHQKTWLFRQQDQTFAYVGGMDPMYNRWDTIEHDQEYIHPEYGFSGWLDETVRIEGPAVADVAHNFMQRYTVRSNQSMQDTVLHTERKGSHAVQIVRTYSCKAKWNTKQPSYAPRGEFTLLQGRIKAIQQAKKYIFIQDQYMMYVPELQAALLDALQHRIQHLIIIVQRIESRFKYVGMEKYQYQCLHDLKRKFPEKVHIFTDRVAKNLYIHSKFMVIDDTFVTIGGGNWNIRSMTSDQEIAANIIDTSQMQNSDNQLVTSFGNHVRNTKLAEAAGLPTYQLRDLTLNQTIEKLYIRARDANSSAIIDIYPNKFKPYFLLIPPFSQKIFDNDGSCGFFQRSLTEKNDCNNAIWLQQQSSYVQTMCKCSSHSSLRSCAEIVKKHWPGPKLD